MPGTLVPQLAKELGINITVHVAMDRFGYTKMQLRGLKDLDLLYPNTTYIHSSHLLEDEWKMVRDSGGNVSLAPQIELQMGHGWAPALTAEKLAELHGIHLARETVRQWMITAGLWKDRRARMRPVHQPRYRRDCLGELIQIEAVDVRSEESRLEITVQYVVRRRQERQVARFSRQV